MVTRIINVRKEEYINPFGTELDKTELYHLSSGVPLPDSISNKILKISEEGKFACTTFIEKRLVKKSVSFHDPIPRHKLHLFSTNEEGEIKGNLLLKRTEVNRDVLGTLLAISTRTNRVVNFEHALRYPMCAVPLSLANADGSRRITAKSKLMKIIEERCKSPMLHPRESLPIKESVAAYIVDFMSFIRIMTEIPETYEEFTWKFLEMLPRGYRRVDIIVDTYRQISIKTNERKKRGCSRKIIIRSKKSKIPRDFHTFLKNGENKNRMIELMTTVIEQQSSNVLALLQSEEILISTDNRCVKITAEKSETVDELVSNHEEADTKVVLHCMHAHKRQPEQNVIIRSPSGDTDIIVIMLGKIIEKKSQTFIDSGNGLHRKGLWLSNVDMCEDTKLSLIGFHAFTGNDYISCFFRKSKAMCWKIIEKNPRFRSAFESLGMAWKLSPAVYEMLEEYVCYLYGFRKKNVNEVRYQIFRRKYSNENKITDLALLPPCHDVLYYHTSRANVVARLWKLSNEPQVKQPNLIDHGWMDRNDIKWMDEAFPGNIEEMLRDIDHENDISLGVDDETDEDNDTDS